MPVAVCHDCVAALFVAQTPIDEIDAAARVLDPVFACADTAGPEPPFGQFFKDYFPSEW